MAVPADEKPRFDVSDVSYLWPVPNTQADVDALISADIADAASKVALWDEAAFKRMLEIVTSDDARNQAPERSGAGGSPCCQSSAIERTGRSLLSARPERPRRPPVDRRQIRFHAAASTDRPACDSRGGQSQGARLHGASGLFLLHAEGGHQARFLPAANPDEAKFRSILDDLAALKAKLKAKGIDTQGVPLGVHPGLKNIAGGADFANDVRALLTRHVNVKNLFAMAFMGLPDASPEPWIFVAADKLG